MNQPKQPKATNSNSHWMPWMGWTIAGAIFLILLLLAILGVSAAALGILNNRNCDYDEDAFILSQNTESTLAFASGPGVPSCIEQCQRFFCFGPFMVPANILCSKPPPILISCKSYTNCVTQCTGVCGSSTQNIPGCADINILCVTDTLFCLNQPVIPGNKNETCPD